MGRRRKLDERGQVNVANENKVHQVSNGKKQSLVVRRSNRLNSLASPSHSLGVKPVVEHVDLAERGKEQASVLPEVNGKSLEEKVLRRQDDVPSPEINYKNLYINSQKKIEALMEENYDLVRKLEFARGKIAAYEIMKNGMSGLKEVIVVSPRGKPMDITSSLSTQAVQNCSPKKQATR